MDLANRCREIELDRATHIGRFYGKSLGEMSPKKAKFLETNSFSMYKGTAGSDEEDDDDTKRMRLARGDS
jgi:hypothetical protein